MKRAFRTALFILCAALVASPAQAAPDTRIRVGAMFSLSGWGGSGGTSELNGALMAKDEINEKGGIAGKKLELIVEDNRSDLKDTAAAFRKLSSSDNVAAIVGPNWAEFSEIVAPLAESAHVPFITPSGYRDGLFEGKKFSFSLWPPHSVAVAPLAAYLSAHHYRSIAVLLSENTYLEGIYDALKPKLEGAGIRLEPLLRFNQGQNDFRAAVTRLAKDKPDAILGLLTENGDLSNFLVQARQLKLALPFYTANGIPFDEIIQKTPSIAEGAVYFDFLTPGSNAFAARYRTKFKREPGFASAKAYDAVFILKDAIEQCGIDRQEVRNCLSKTAFNGQSGHIAFDSNGLTTAREKNTSLFQVKNGAFEKLSDSGS